MADLSHGVKATIIDFGLSRMETNLTSTIVRPHSYGQLRATQWTAFDETIFQGEGNLHLVVRRCACIHRID